MGLLLHAYNLFPAPTLFGYNSALAPLGTFHPGRKLGRHESRERSRSSSEGSACDATIRGVG
jgi:hypothetical protein